VLVPLFLLTFPSPSSPLDPSSLLSLPPFLPPLYAESQEGVFLEQLETDVGKYLPEVMEDSLGKDVVKVDLKKPMSEIRKQLSQYPIKTRLSLTGRLENGGGGGGDDVGLMATATTTTATTTTTTTTTTTAAATTITITIAAAAAATTTTTVHYCSVSCVLVVRYLGGGS